ncbi:hypothetical protein Tco_1388623 [Tanacetum coccineum]
MEEINHFSHEKHPLKLINSAGNKEKPEGVGCFGCAKPISPSDSTWFYGLCFSPKDEAAIFALCALSCWCSSEISHKAVADACALSTPPPSTPRDRPSTSGANEDLNSLLHFPMLDVFTDPLKLLHLDKLSLDDNDELVIKHWSHNHSLILNVEP